MTVYTADCSTVSTWPYDWSLTASTSVVTVPMIYTATNSVVWETWNTQYANTATAAITVSNTAIWTEWNNIYIARPQIVRAREEADAQMLNAYLEQEAKRLAAAAKARTLLLEFLDDGQKEQLALSNAFELAIDNRRYRIRPGNRVERLNESGQVVSRFCIHPPHSHQLPPDDVALSQKLLLEANEAEFLRTANETRVA